LETLVWLGAAVSVLGLLGILGCILSVVRARRAGMNDADLRARLRRIVVWNMAALLTSATGLGLVAVGVILA